MPVATPAFAYNSPQEAWYWNGTALQSSFWNIGTFGGSRFGLPTLRGQDYQVPYRAGQSWRAKYPDERTLSLVMWLDGSGSAFTGFPAADQRLAFNSNWQQLRQMFWTRNANGSVQGQLQRNWYLPSGGPGLVTGTAMAEIAGSMDLTMNGRTGAAFTVDLLLADPYFAGAQVTQVITTAGGTITNPGEGVAGENFASPVNRFTVTVSAPCTVTNVTAGISFTLAAGPSYPVTVDALAFTVTDPAGANQQAAFSHAGSRLWMGLVPGANVITVSAGTATFVFCPPYV